MYGEARSEEIEVVSATFDGARKMEANGSSVPMDAASETTARWILSRTALPLKLEPATQN